MKITAPVHVVLVRQHLGLTQRQLGAALGLTGKHRGQYISSMERGHREIPRHVALLLAAYFSGWRPADWHEMVSEGDEQP